MAVRLRRAREGGALDVRAIGAGGTGTGDREAADEGGAGQESRAAAKGKGVRQRTPFAGILRRRRRTRDDDPVGPWRHAMSRDAGHDPWGVGHLRTRQIRLTSRLLPIGSFLDIRLRLAGRSIRAGHLGVPGGHPARSSPTDRHSCHDQVTITRWGRVARRGGPRRPGARALPPRSPERDRTADPRSVWPAWRSFRRRVLERSGRMEECPSEPPVPTLQIAGRSCTPRSSSPCCACCSSSAPASRA